MFFQPFFPYSLRPHFPFVIALTARHCNVPFCPGFFLFFFSFVLLSSCCYLFLFLVTVVVHHSPYYYFLLLCFSSSSTPSHFYWIVGILLAFKIAIELIIKSSAFHSSTEMLFILLIVLFCLLHVPSNSNKFHCFCDPFHFNFQPPSPYSVFRFNVSILTNPKI